MLKKVSLIIFGLFVGAFLFAPIFTVGQERIPITFVQYITSDESNVIEPVFLAGMWRLPVDANISSVNVPFGRDPVPDAYFTVIDTGLEGDTIKIDIAGTTADPSIPDDDVPAFSKTFTIVAGEVGDEGKLASRIISELNSDTAFKDDSFLKAQRARDRKVVHIFSKKFSLVAEFYERTVAGDFNITVTGSASVFEPNTRLISRAKETALTQDPDNPHLLGRPGFFGDVTQTPGELSELFIEKAENTGSPDFRVDGSITPVEFLVPCDAIRDIFITEMRFYSGCNGLKYTQFLCKNSPITNGIIVEIQSDEKITILPLIKSTEDFKNQFAFGSGDNFRFDDVAGADQMLAVFILPNPFPIRMCGTFSPIDDHLKITIQDDLSSGLLQFELIAKGFLKEP